MITKLGNDLINGNKFMRQPKKPSMLKNTLLGGGALIGGGLLLKKFKPGMFNNVKNSIQNSFSKDDDFWDSMLAMGGMM